jgi:hypothetical protein
LRWGAAHCLTAIVVALALCGLSPPSPAQPLPAKPVAPTPEDPVVNLPTGPVASTAPVDLPPMPKVDEVLPLYKLPGPLPPIAQCGLVLLDGSWPGALSVEELKCLGDWSREDHNDIRWAVFAAAEALSLWGTEGFEGLVGHYHESDCDLWVTNSKRLFGETHSGGRIDDSVAVQVLEAFAKGAAQTLNEFEDFPTYPCKGVNNEGYLAYCLWRDFLGLRGLDPRNFVNDLSFAPTPFDGRSKVLGSLGCREATLIAALRDLPTPLLRRPGHETTLDGEDWLLEAGVSDSICAPTRRFQARKRWPPRDSTRASVQTVLNYRAAVAWSLGASTTPERLCGSLGASCIAEVSNILASEDLGCSNLALIEDRIWFVGLSPALERCFPKANAPYSIRSPGPGAAMITRVP